MRRGRDLHQDLRWISGAWQVMAGRDFVHEAGDPEHLRGERNRSDI